MMGWLLDLLDDPAMLNIAAGLFLALWTALKARQGHAGKVTRIIDAAVASSVTRTYHAYVEDLKRTQDGEPRRLKPDERRKALAKAKRAAIDEAKSRAVDLMSRLSEGELEYMIEKLIVTMKGVLKT